MSMPSSEQALEQLAASLNNEFETDIPNAADIWVLAEKLARVYRIIGKPDVSRRYFRMAAHGKEHRLMAFRMEHGRTAYIANRAHVALLYRYAGEAEKAHSIFDQAAVEANVALYGPFSNEGRQSLLETLLLIDLINSNYAEAARHLDALKDACARQPGSFRPVHKAIDAALRAREVSDEDVARQAVASVQEFIDQRHISPYVTGRISEWDILDLLDAISDAPQPTHSEEQSAALLNSMADKAARAARLGQLLEYDLPTFGLSWTLAERIARLYKSLGNDQAARSYFEVAAQGAEAQIAELAHHYHKYHKELAFVECTGHAAWLYHWAGDEEKKHALADGAIAKAEAGLQKYKVSVDIRFFLLETLVHMNLLKGNVKVAWQHISETKEMLATVGIDRVKPPASLLLETTIIWVGAKALDDRELAQRATAHLEKIVAAADLPIDITGCVAGRDLLEVLQGLK